MTTVIILISVIALLLISLILLLRIKVNFSILKENQHPYAFETINVSSEKKDVILFGKNKYLLAENFGSDKDISVIPLQQNITYLEMLQQSAAQPSIIRSILLKGEASDFKKVGFSHVAFDANGNLAERPILLASYMKPNVSEREEVCIDFRVPDGIEIDGNSYFKFELKPNATITWFLYFNTLEYKKISLLKYIFSKHNLKS